MKQMANAFAVQGRVLTVRPYGNGHIHQTYRVAVKTPDGIGYYILQKINTRVFPDPLRVMENIAVVTDHLREKIRGRGGGDIRRRVLSVIPTRDQRSCLVTGEGEFWRMYAFIENSVSYDVLSSRDMIYQVGRRFGEFLDDMRDLPPERLPPAIPHFHDAPRRFDRFLTVLNRDPCRRRSGARPEIEFLLSHRSLFGKIPDLVNRGQLRQTVTHNDTKVNNVLFDPDTGESLCVIDLDTVMPGVILFDFGDLARSSLGAVPEDETDLSRIRIRLPVFQSLLRGFLTPIRHWISELEKELLFHSIQLMPTVIGMRFLTDYLEGDVYFKTQRPGHNLVRCRTQFGLVRAIEARREEMLGIQREVLEELAGS